MATAQKRIENKNVPKEDVNGLNENSSLRYQEYWESNLFSKVYLSHDLKRDFSERWERDYDDTAFDKNGDHVKTGFFHFYKEFRNIAKSLRSLSGKNLSETQTISKVIYPMLNCLGWYDKCDNSVDLPFDTETSFTIKSSPKNKTYRTDVLLVDHPQEATFIGDPEDAEKRKKEARKYCILPLEAKYWNRILDKEKSDKKEDPNRADKHSDDTNSAASFNDQIINYMSILNKRWGIVTDGNIWRLVNSEVSSESSDRCFQFRLEALLAQEANIEDGETDDLEFLENAKYFYLLFGKKSFVGDETGKIFVDEVLRNSRKYIDEVEEDLKDRFISAMNYMCDGLLSQAKSQGTMTQPTDKDLKLIRTVAESHLFNILFIRSCEANGILPIKAPAYYDFSLTKIIDRISVYDPEKTGDEAGKKYLAERLKTSLMDYGYKPQGESLYKSLVSLTEIIHDGTSGPKFGFTIEGFKESVFSKEEWSFAKRHRLSDECLVNVLFQLGYSKASTSIQRDYQQIPYNYFTARQMGSIYESFLEYKLEIAQEQMVYIKKGQHKQWVKLTAAVQSKLEGFEPLAKKGQAFFTPNNSDRLDTGSYYTPDYLVSFMVSTALAPLCEGKSSQEILKMRVCDPAMGSGHFAVGALNFLADRYLVALEAEVAREDMPSKGEAKRAVLEKCIYGADINNRAVKLAKLGLWLESAVPGQKLERLCDQIVEGNTLRESVVWSEHTELEKNGFDSVIGNPPFAGKKRRSTSQNEDMELVFKGEESFKSLDYVASWYPVILNKLLKPKGQAVLVSSSSICQGEQVSLLWEPLIKNGCSINFAVRPFLWPKKDAHDAAVNVVIVGFSKTAYQTKLLGEHNAQDMSFKLIPVKNISPYLIDFDSIIIGNRQNPISSDVPIFNFGNQPNDGGHLLFDSDEYAELVRLQPKAKTFIRKCLGAEEFLHNKSRYCLWLQNVDPAKYAKIPEITSILEKVKKNRKESARAATKELAKTPHLFGFTSQGSTDYLLIPCHTSENRRYIPIGFIDANTVTLNSCLTSTEATLFHFGILSSYMHMVWVRTVCGRLENRIRYSNKLVYNNFPWPEGISSTQKTAVESAASEVLKLRKEYNRSSLAEMYDADEMPKALEKAHLDLDRAVEKCYSKNSFESDTQILELLFEQYAQQLKGKIKKAA